MMRRRDEEETIMTTRGRLVFSLHNPIQAIHIHGRWQEYATTDGGGVFFKTLKVVWETLIVVWDKRRRARWFPLPLSVELVMNFRLPRWWQVPLFMIAVNMTIWPINSASQPRTASTGKARLGLEQVSFHNAQGAHSVERAQPYIEARDCDGKNIESASTSSDSTTKTTPHCCSPHLFHNRFIGSHDGRANTAWLPRHSPPFLDKWFW